MGYLLTHGEDGQIAIATISDAERYAGGFLKKICNASTMLDLVGQMSKAEFEVAANILSNSIFIAAALALINTPRIVGQRTHAPHRGLQKRLLRGRRPIGKFPLRAWTEILLRITRQGTTVVNPRAKSI